MHQRRVACPLAARNFVIARSVPDAWRFCSAVRAAVDRRVVLRMRVAHVDACGYNGREIAFLRRPALPTRILLTGSPATPMPSRYVRQAAVTDADDIAACLSALGYGTSASLVADRLASFVGSTTDAVFVASSEGGTRLLGVISAHLLPLFHAPGLLGRITSLAVRPEARGAGVGRALVTAAEEWAWVAGAVRMEVTSGDHRAGAHAFYRAVGYALDERRFIKHAAKKS